MGRGEDEDVEDHQQPKQQEETKGERRGTRSEDRVGIEEGGGKMEVEGGRKEGPVRKLQEFGMVPTLLWGARPLQLPHDLGEGNWGLQT